MLVFLRGTLVVEASAALWCVKRRLVMEPNAVVTSRADVA